MINIPKLHLCARISSYLIVTLLLGLLLQACGGGNNDEASSPDGEVSKSPVISAVVPEKSQLSFKGSENSSQEIILSIKYDNASSVSRTLNVSWSSSDQKFAVNDTENTQYVVELLDDAENQSKKTLKITEPVSQKIFEVAVDIEVLPVSISQIELLSDKSELNVGESVTLGVNITYSNNETVNNFPEGVSCSLQEGKEVITLSSDCIIKAKAPGSAKIAVNTTDVLLADNIMMPIVEITVVQPVVEPQPVDPKIVSLTSDKDMLTVNDGSASSHSITLIRSYDDQTTKEINLQIQWQSTEKNFQFVSSSSSESFVTQFDSASNKLTISDPLSSLNKTLSITIDPLQITKLILTTLDKKQLVVGETAELKVSAVYDNGSTEDDVTSKVRCKVLGDSPSVSVNNCKVTAIGAGTTDIGAELLSPQVNAPVVDIVTFTSEQQPKITGISLDSILITVNSSVSSSQILFLTKSFDTAPDKKTSLNVQWHNDTKTFSVLSSDSFSYKVSFDDSNFANGSGILSITDADSGFSDSVDVAIAFPSTGPAIDVLRFDTATKEMVSGQVESLVVLAEYSDKQIKQINNLVRCSSSDGGIIVSQSCDLQAMFPGTYKINLDLLDKSNASPSMQTQALQLVVNPVVLHSLAISNSFDLNQNVDTSAIAFKIDQVSKGETYKIVLKVNSELGITKNLILHTLREAMGGSGCANYAYLTESSVACGLKATNSDIYVYLEDPSDTKLGLLDYKLSIEPDNNILKSDGEIGGNYQILEVGTGFSGHVAANIYGTGSISYYKTDVTHGMNKTGGDYVVTVIFKSPFYNSDSVVVESDFNRPDCIDPSYPFQSMTIECVVKNENDGDPSNKATLEILIEISGNAFYGASLTTVEGEVEYDIMVTQNAKP